MNNGCVHKNRHHYKQIKNIIYSVAKWNSNLTFELLSFIRSEVRTVGFVSPTSHVHSSWPPKVVLCRHFRTKERWNNYKTQNWIRMRFDQMKPEKKTTHGEAHLFSGRTPRPSRCHPQTDNELSFSLMREPTINLYIEQYSSFKPNETILSYLLFLWRCACVSLLLACSKQCI